MIRAPSLAQLNLLSMVCIISRVTIRLRRVRVRVGVRVRVRVKVRVRVRVGVGVGVGVGDFSNMLVYFELGSCCLVS
jgi:hypothetical protein